MRFLSVKGWQTYQHYKDRRPPWIKLYGSLLTDLAFLQLPEAAQAQLIKLWVLASQFGHPLPNNPKLLAGKIGTTGKFHLATIIASGFLIPCDESDSATIAEDKENASKDASKDASMKSHDDEENASTDASTLARPRARSRESTERENRNNKKPSASDDAVSKGADTWLTPFADAWFERYGGKLAMGTAAKALRPLVDEWGPDETRRRWGIYLAATEGSYANPAKFGQTFGEWNKAPSRAVGGVRLVDAAHTRAVALWPHYADVGFVSKKPFRDQVDHAATAAVERGFSPSADAYVAELKIAQPWTLGTIKNDDYAIEQIAQRLRAKAVAA